jgi:hypothetical protein
MRRRPLAAGAASAVTSAAVVAAAAWAVADAVVVDIVDSISISFVGGCS